MKENLFKLHLIISTIVLIVTILCLILLICFDNGPALSIKTFLRNNWLVLLGLIPLITILFGRIFCSLLCPFGIVQNLVCTFNEIESVERNKSTKRYVVLGSAFVLVVLFAILLVKMTANPIKILSVLVLMGIIIAGICALMKKRMFCIDICPCGSILELLSKISLFKMKINKSTCLCCGICENNCPSSSINSEVSELQDDTCVKCFKCFSHGARESINYGIKRD